MEDIARLGTLVPFRKVGQLLARFRQVTVHEATARRVTEGCGAEYEAVQSMEVEELERTAPVAPQGPAVQQTSADGAMVPLVGGEWGEVKTLVIGAVTTDHTGEPRATDLSYFSRMLDHERFSRLATVETHRRGTEGARAVCAVVDGADWLQQFIDLHRPDAVRILDFPHAASYVAQAAQAAFGVGTAQTSEWMGRQLHALRHGGEEQVLDALRTLLKPPAAPGAMTQEGRQTVTTSLGYLEKRREQIRYAAFRAQGYPIGSGAVESANKLLVEDRLKGPGMHWSRAHVNPMLALRTLDANERWGEGWPAIQRHQHARLRERATARRKARRPSPPPPAPTTPATSNSRPTTATGTAQPLPQQRSPSPRRPAPDHPWRRMSLGRRSNSSRLHPKK